MAEELGERSEAPTEHKLREARNKGQVAKSQDLSAVVSLFGGVVILAISGAQALMLTGVYMRRGLDLSDGASALTVQGAVAEFGASMLIAGESLWLPFLVIALIALIGQITQVGFLFTTTPITPDLKRLSPSKGLKRLIGKQNLIKTGSSVAKLIVVIIVTTLVMRLQTGRIAGLMNKPLWYAVEEAGWLVLELTAWLLVLLLAIAFIDFAFQRWQHKDQLKMTKQQVKEERKSMEGDMEMRGRRIRMGRELIMQQVNSAVPNADVVVTNPTHFSVALKYDGETMRAPRVIAKGADLLAFKIRQLAQIHGVAIVERPPLARALYAGVAVGQEVSPEHYQAVAELLAYVYRLNDDARATPVKPRDTIPIAKEPQPAA